MILPFSLSIFLEPWAPLEQPEEQRQPRGWKQMAVLPLERRAQIYAQQSCGGAGPLLRPAACLVLAAVRMRVRLNVHSQLSTREVIVWIQQ